MAIATPPGRGGIGVVRLSGPEALAIATPLLRLGGALEPRRAQFCAIVDPANADKLDEAVATYFQAPRSYTGENVLEIACHGAPVLLEFVLRACVARGARLANAGEFTERAFLGGRLDLTQAEAVRDLIEAQTLYQARMAASQLSGALSRRVAPVKVALIGLIAQLEAGIDFAEDDTPVLQPEHIVALATPIAVNLASLGRSFEHGRLVHQGLSLAIIGEPNVGKSSLFNALVERERAIVTASPGTTRDLVTERISLGGLPLELVDTAGLRTATPAEPLDEAEKIGIERSRQALAEADLILVVVDATVVRAHQRAGCETPGFAVPEQTRELLHSLAGRPAILVINKVDLLSAAPEAGGSLGSFETPPTGYGFASGNQEGSGLPVASTSARSGAGVAELRRLIAEQVQVPDISQSAGVVTNLRQHQAVASATEAVTAAIEAANAKTPHEMLLLDLYRALTALDSLTGATTSDDILHLIFSTFCIGK